MAFKPGALLEIVIAFLLPYFTGASVDINDARAEIIDTLASYATRTRAELLMAAQIIALGMTTLDVLHEAKTAEMSMSMRIRHRGCARGLNRATLQTEKALDHRLACEAPNVSETTPEEDAAEETALIAKIEQVKATLAAHHARTFPAPTPEVTEQERHRQRSALAMIDALNQMGVPIQLISQGERFSRPSGLTAA